MLKRVTLLMLLFWAGGCATVRPQSQPVHPTAVYLADYGIHSSLLLPTREGRYVEYAFGDWNFAALNHCWPQDALGALLVSFHSALGRRFIDVQPGQTEPCPLHPAPHHIQRIYLSQASVQKVVDQLDQRYRRDATEVRHNPDNDMDYVPDDEHYWLANNCNHLTARCLREMGCSVWGVVVLSNFWVEPQKVIAAEPAMASAKAPRISTAQAN